MSIDKEIPEENQPKENKRSFAVVVSVILGMIMLGLYMNSNFIGQLITPKQTVTKSNPIKSDIINKAVEATQKVMTQNIAQIERTYETCKETLHFIQDYYRMKLQIAQDQDFENELTELNQYSFKSNELKANLLKLSDLAKSNISNEQLSLKFNAVVKELYQSGHQDSIFYYYLDKLLFIRPIDERAIRNGGMDMEIILIEQALAVKDFNEAKLHMDKLPDNLESLNLLKLDLQHKLDIMSVIAVIDTILANQSDCQMMSK